MYALKDPGFPQLSSAQVDAQAAGTRPAGYFRGTGRADVRKLLSTLSQSQSEEDTIYVYAFFLIDAFTVPTRKIGNNILFSAGPEQNIVCNVDGKNAMERKKETEASRRRAVWLGVEDLGRKQVLRVPVGERHRAQPGYASFRATRAIQAS